MDGRGEGLLTVDMVEKTSTVSIERQDIPIPIPTISDREILYRGAFMKDEVDETYTRIGYSVEDERRPVEEGRVRVEFTYLFLVKEAPGSEGKRSECWRLSMMKPNFGKVLRWVNEIAADKAAAKIASPLLKMKEGVEGALRSYNADVNPEASEADVVFHGFNHFNE
jgi:hypothetical protein